MSSCGRGWRQLRRSWNPKATVLVCGVRPVPGAATFVSSDFLRQIIRKTIDIPLEWSARRARSALLNSNCGF